MYLSKLQNVFVQFAKCNCPNCKSSRQEKEWNWWGWELFGSVVNGCRWLQRRLLEDITTTERPARICPICRYHASLSSLPINEYITMQVQIWTQRWLFRGLKTFTNTDHVRKETQNHDWGSKIDSSSLSVRFYILWLFCSEWKLVLCVNRSLALHGVIVVKRWIDFYSLGMLPMAG